MAAEERKPRTWTLKTGFVYVGWLALVGVICTIFLNLFYAAPYLRDPDGKISLVDRTTISLNSLGLALVLATLVVGAVAIIGWQKLEDTIRRDVEDSVRERLKTLEILMQGRVISFIGYAIGELSTEPDQMDAIHKDRLSEAVEHCRIGYELLSKAGERGKMLTGLNNLVYYSSIYGDEFKGRHLLEQARILRDAGDEFSFPPYLLTFCRAVLRYSKDKNEIEQAKAIASELLARKLTQQQEREARFYLTSLTRRRSASPAAAESLSP